MVENATMVHEHSRERRNLVRKRESGCNIKKISCGDE